MERTIDGIEYIAKGEVLRILNDEIKSGDEMAKASPQGSEQLHTWSGYIAAMIQLKRRLVDSEER